MKLELHPLCAIFPRMLGEDFAGLKADIKANGLLHPITVFEGKILDGGNRHQACVELGIDIKTTDYAGSDPVAFVMSENKHRRHLTQMQLALVVALAQDWTEAKRHGNYADEKVSARDGHLPAPTTTAARANKSGAGYSTQRRADALAKASPELAKQVVDGGMPMHEASIAAGLSDPYGNANRATKSASKEADPESLPAASASPVSAQPKTIDPLTDIRKEVRTARKKGYPTALIHYARQAVSFIKVQSTEDVKFSDEEIVVLREIADAISDSGVEIN